LIADGILDPMGPPCLQGETVLMLGTLTSKQEYLINELREYEPQISSPQTPKSEIFPDPETRDEVRPVKNYLDMLQAK